MANWGSHERSSWTDRPINTPIVMLIVIGVVRYTRIKHMGLDSGNPRMAVTQSIPDHKMFITYIKNETLVHTLSPLWTLTISTIYHGFCVL